MGITKTAGFALKTNQMAQILNKSLGASGKALHYSNASKKL